MDKPKYSRHHLRNKIALTILSNMIETKGTKAEKVKAAFEYTEIFLKESERYIEEDSKSVYNGIYSEESSPWFGLK